MHPEITGVSSGAILSNYQRNRVENVCVVICLYLTLVRCARLGLVSVAYLWQRDQKELLKEMIDSDIEAIMIKVAAIGLSKKHLGKTIRDMYPYLCELVSFRLIN